MEETVFPPSPSWFLPNIISSREDGSISYGSKNNLVILKVLPNKNTETLIIPNAHTLKVTSVVFSPSNCNELYQNTVASCSEDGFVKLWNIDTLSATMGHKFHWEPIGDVGKIICLDWSIANPHQIISAAENNTLVLWDILSNTTEKFSFPNLGATVIACCPYNEKIVAVGGKTGQIFIINLTGNGNIVYKLRGHDNKIHSLTWCPVPYNIFKKNEVHEEFLLASACQDKEVFIWRAGSDGKCEIKFQIPTCSLLKRDGGQHHRKLGNSFSYSALLWSDPYKIYASSNFGELIYYDIHSYLMNKSLEVATPVQKFNKQSLNCFKLGHNFHSKGLFAIVGSPLIGEVVIYENIAIKSDLKYKIQSNNCSVVESSKTENERKEYLKWEVIPPKISPLLWTAGQDRKLVGCRLNSCDMEMIYNFHTMNGVVYCAVVSPHDPNKIAIGVGDGMIRLWNLTEPGGEIQVYWQKIKDRVMTLSWHPSKDGLLAYGTSEGRIGLVDTNSNKLPSVFKPSHPDPIYNLSWGPQFPSGGSSVTKTEFDLYGVGGNTLSVYSPQRLSADPINLSKIIAFPCKKQTDVSWKPDFSLMAVGNEDGCICLLEPSEFKIVHTLFAYKKLIQSIAWHPLSTSLDSGLSPYHGYFTSGSTDNENEIRIFNCTQEETEIKVDQVATLKGHYGHIQSVSWSPHIGGRLISSSVDYSVQIWDVISQSPLVNFESKEIPMFSVLSPIDSDIILTGCRNDILSVWRISTQTKVSPTMIVKTKKQKKDKKIQMISAKEINQGTSESVKNGKENEVFDIPVAEAKTTAKNAKEIKMFSKAWKGDVKNKLEICYSMLKEEKAENNGVNYSLPFFSGEDQYKELIKSEEESYIKANNWNEYYELALWNGNIKDVLEEKIKSGQLNDFLVSLAPIISPRAWQEACLSYSKTLAEKKMFRKAASYLVICHKIYEAVELLTDANLYLEALCIARSRLPKSDPVIKNIINQYAVWLFKNGSILKACECYIYLENYLEVAKVCRKKSQPEYLSLAALAAKKCGNSDLESSEATNAILKCFESNDFELARRICNDHCNLKHLHLMYSMYYAIRQLDVGELFLEKDILSHVKESSQMEDLVFLPSLQQLYHKYTFYRNKEQMLIIVAQELSFACCEKDTINIVTHLIKALSTSYRYINTSENEVHPLLKLCTWLSPGGFLSENSYFTLTESDLLPKVKSLRAFLGSAVTRNLSENPLTDNLAEYLDVLSRLKDDLLDRDAYKYFKNLIDVEICEKRLMTNRNELARIKVTNKKEKHVANPDISENSIVMENCKINENGILENELSESLSLGEVATDDTSENLKESLKEVTKKESENFQTERSSEGESGNTDSSQLQNDGNLNEKILEDTELLSKLKNEIESFETVRVSSPNPVSVYFMLKKLLEGISLNDSATLLLEYLEKKWSELN